MRVLRYLTNKWHMLAMQMTGIKLQALLQKSATLCLCGSFICFLFLFFIYFFFFFYWLVLRYFDQ